MPVLNCLPSPCWSCQPRPGFWPDHCSPPSPSHRKDSCPRQIPAAAIFPLLPDHCQPSYQQPGRSLLCQISAVARWLLLLDPRRWPSPGVWPDPSGTQIQTTEKIPVAARSLLPPYPHCHQTSTILVVPCHCQTPAVTNLYCCHILNILVLCHRYCRWAETNIAAPGFCTFGYVNKEILQARQAKRRKNWSQNILQTSALSGQII